MWLGLHRRRGSPAATAAPAPVATTAAAPDATAAPAATDAATAPAGDIPDLSAYKIGFAQVGAESGWRTANTKSIQESATEAGTDLLFTDAQGKQESQVESIRGFIEQKVDLIAFSPVVETGWDAVLGEAKAAGIPVILTDRAIDSKETDLYKTFLGSDFILEGEKAGDWVNDGICRRRQCEHRRTAGHDGLGTGARSCRGFPQQGDRSEVQVRRLPDR